MLTGCPWRRTGPKSSSRRGPDPTAAAARRRRAVARRADPHRGPSPAAAESGRRPASLAPPLPGVLDHRPDRASPTCGWRCSAGFARPSAWRPSTQAAHRRNARRVERGHRRAPGPVHQGRPAHQHHGQLPARGLPPRAGGPAGPGARRGPTRTSRRACARSSAAAAPSEVFAEFARRADRLGVDRPGAPWPACTRGEKVAVKVQYPDIEEIVRTDLRALRRIFGLLGRFMPEWGFDTIYREIREMVLAELDYRAEAEAMRQIGGQLRRAARTCCCPRVMAEYSTARVLTTEWMDGTKVADLERPGGRGDRSASGRRAWWSRPTASRSSSTASITPIRTPGTCCSGRAAARATGPPWCSWTSAPPPSVSQGMRKGMVSFLQGAMTARHRPHRLGDEGDGVHLPPGRPRGVRPRGGSTSTTGCARSCGCDGFSLKDIRFEPEPSWPACSICAS